MKRKIFKVLACVLVLSVVMVWLVACNGKTDNKDNDKNNNNKSNTVNITILPDMTDYGQSAYYNVAKVDYSSSKMTEWTGKLNDKLHEEHENWRLPGEEEWNNDNYYSFGAITGEDNNKKREHRFGYLTTDSEGKYYWEDSDSANTVERIFCYSKPEAFLEVLSEQGIKAAYTEGMVEYITRNDDAYDNRKEYYEYEFTIGEGSALQDYRELEELEEIYNDWDESEIAEKSAFANSDEVSDAVNLKNRKISGEVFNIFGDAADQFALTAIALLEYSTYVIENVMIPAYETEYAKIATDETEYKDLFDLSTEDGGDYEYLSSRDTAGSYEEYQKFINYMRAEMYDYETLSYILSFREYADMPIVTAAESAADYEVGNMAEPMTLFGYHYQFRHRDYNFYDTDETYNFRDTESIVDGSTNLDKYEYFLKLSHESYFASSGSGATVNVTSEDEQYAMDYRKIDREHYEQAYRYSTACLTAYYEAQLDFQIFQERMEVDIYVGGSKDSSGEQLYARGIQYAKQLPGQSYSQTTTKTYSQEMYNALGNKGSALDSNLKISDVNWEYSADDMTTRRFNLVSARWLSIEDNGNLNDSQRLYKVEYEIELLKSQDYTLNHGYLSNSDFTHALQYEIYSYSADSVRGIQQNKKNNVIYAKDIERMNKVENLGVTGYYEAMAELEENVGRNRAEYANLDHNYDTSNVTSEINLSGEADWAGVRSNVKETLAVDYAGYNQSKDGSDKPVDKLFEDTLIKQFYVCKSSASDAGQRGGTEDHCLVNNNSGHTPYCEEDYDPSWALSRLANNHETSLRYMYGQSEVTFARMKVEELIEAGKFTSAGSGAFNGGSNSYFVTSGNQVSTETLNTDDEIDTVLRDASDKWLNLPSYDGEYGNVKEEGNEFTFNINGVNYKITFIGWFVDAELKYEVLYDEEYNYDIVLYPAYRIEVV